MKKLLCGLFVSLVLSFNVYPLPSLEEECTWNEQLNEWDCTESDPLIPIYYTWLYVEPDWCLYNPNDQVELQFNSDGEIVAWYVWKNTDSGFHSNYVVFHGNEGACFLVYRIY